MGLSNYNERRSDNRQEFQGDLTGMLVIEGLSLDLKAIAENISINGLGIKTMEVMPLKQQVYLRHKGHTIVLETVWCRPSPHADGSFLTGLRSSSSVNLLQLASDLPGCRIFTGPHSTIA